MIEVSILLPIFLTAVIPIFCYLFYELGKTNGHIEYLEKDLKRLEEHGL